MRKITKPIKHRHILGKIRKEFDEAKSLNLILVYFRPKHDQLDIEFLEAPTSPQLEQLQNYLRSKWGNHITCEIFSLPRSLNTTMRIKNVRHKRIEDERRRRQAEKAHEENIRNMAKKLAKAIDRDILTELLNSQE